MRRKRRSIVIGVAVVALVLIGVGVIRAVTRAPGQVPAGRSDHTIDIGGTERTFHLYRPARLSSPASLVVMLHGGFGSGSQAERAYGWDKQADAAGFVVAYPDGLNRAWNTTGGCCGPPAENNTDDIGFITRMVATIGQQVPIDANRVYATGMSNGGVMSYTLACHTTVFAAIGPVAGTQLGDCAHPQPLSVIHVHGTADENIPYNGGRGSGVAHIDGPSAPALDATWRAIDGCAPPTLSTQGALTTSIATCGPRAVELITVAGGGHSWPPEATATIWRFFADHPK